MVEHLPSPASMISKRSPAVGGGAARAAGGLCAVDEQPGGASEAHDARSLAEVARIESMRFLRLV